MSSLYWAVAMVVTAPQRLRERSERGDITLQQVIWAALIASAAVAVIAIIVGVINSYVARIPQ